MHVGIDLVKISRFENVKHLDKIFTKKELLYLEKNYNHKETIAGMYAAKEAFLKATKKGIHQCSLLDIEILHQDDKVPFILLHGQLKKETPYSNIEVSISHDGDYATAIVLLTD